MMSNLRLSSSGSPSLEPRTAEGPRQPQPPQSPPQPQPPQPPPSQQPQQPPSPPSEAPPKPSACRSLFGPVDHGELARELRRHRREQEEASRARWNFDFQRHRPLHGRFQWQALSAQALPDFYSRSPAAAAAAGAGTAGGRWRGHGAGSPPGKEEEEQEKKKKGDSGSPVALGAAGKEDLARQRKRPPPAAGEGGDSFPPNKRANMTEEAISDGSPSASSVEQTPKKSSPRQCPT